MEIQDKLKILATLKPGYTLSTTSMAIMDYNSFKTSIWRTYYGENKNQMLDTIKNILDTAIEELQLSFHLKVYIIEALNGISTLRETYRGYYYTMSSIDRMVNDAMEKIMLKSKEMEEKNNRMELEKNNSMELEKNNSMELEKNNSMELENNFLIHNKPNSQVEVKPRIFKRRPRCRGM